MLRDRILKLDTKDQQALSSILEESHPSANTLRDILRLASEVAARDKISLAEVFTQESVSLLLGREGLSRKDKQRLIKKEMERLRYPERRRLEDRAQELCRELVKDTGLRMELPKDLEGGTIAVRVSERSPEGFAEIADKFNQLSQHPSCVSLFNLLNGVE